VYGNGLSRNATLRLNNQHNEIAEGNFIPRGGKYLSHWRTQASRLPLTYLADPLLPSWLLQW